MNDFLLVFALVAILFGLCFLAMAIGLLVRRMILRGGCGSHAVIVDGEKISCGACPKKEIDLCESDDETGLAKIAAVGTMGRFDKDKPQD